VQASLGRRLDRIDAGGRDATIVGFPLRTARNGRRAHLTEI
jgi:hypothetical protein